MTEKTLEESQGLVFPGSVKEAMSPNNDITITSQHEHTKKLTKENKESVRTIGLSLLWYKHIF